MQFYVINYNFKKLLIQFAMSISIRLTEKEQGRIDALKSEGYSNRNIAKKIKRSHNVVNNYLKLRIIRTGREERSKNKGHAHTQEEDNSPSFCQFA